MKTTEIPKGVKFSFLMMSFPLICTTTYLGLLAPIMASATSTVDPASFAYLARTCLRLLALNISFTVRFLFLNDREVFTMVLHRQLMKQQWLMKNWSVLSIKWSTVLCQQHFPSPSPPLFSLPRPLPCQQWSSRLLVSWSHNFLLSRWTLNVLRRSLLLSGSFASDQWDLLVTWHWQLFSSWSSTQD